ncbi:MAG: xanthine dehydrogenase family protein subunit M [Thermoanaerobaculia bacterium]
MDRFHPISVKGAGNARTGRPGKLPKGVGPFTCECLILKWMYLRDFRFQRPESVEEACNILDTTRDAVLLAGGTDLLVELKQGKRRHRDLVSLTRIPELKSIRLDGDRLSIGAGVTHSQLMASHLVRERWPVIGEAAATIASEQVRNAATVGGNLCTAASCSDTAPILMALEAELELVSSRQTRVAPVQGFFVSHRETVLQQGEVLTRILVPLPTPGSGACYEKFGLREAASIAVASVAARVEMAGGVCAAACLVMGAVAPTPRVSHRAAELIEGTLAAELTGDERLLQRVGEAAAADAEPIDDIRGSAEYRRALIAVLVPRALLGALRRAEEASRSNGGAGGVGEPE